MTSLADVDWSGATVFALAVSVCTCIVLTVISVTLLGRDLEDDAASVLAGLLGACVGIVSTHAGIARSIRKDGDRG